MTTFLISHNLQLPNGSIPSLTASELAEGLKSHCDGVITAEALSHHHWLVRLVGKQDPHELASQLVGAWASLREGAGHDVDHAILALGGRKDSPASSGSPLDLGSWGVDVVETMDPKGFLEAINWQALKAARPADGVFEVERLPAQG
ncbi:DUF2656 family protein [Cyanobium sp. HWJ4-Hawea]|uniref:DUF2656 family protein n=1 Tax=Cyanobium sp. HWJ4-Hawea TaxID=2823713 RepID=UPI0020CE90AD|nr:DUF2656 family protein [Cyanobium sp. HWJ4-Hawea]MCP9809495.1 DUF2656 family protein [Cyanobium sp. HWJ4-Hawea]